MCFIPTVSGNWTLHLWKGFSYIFHWDSESRFSFLLRTSSHGRCVAEPRCCWIASPRCLTIHLLWIRCAEVAKKLNVARNGSTSFPTAGQSTCSGGFLSPLHACLSLNTWQVKPDGTGWVVGLEGLGGGGGMGGGGEMLKVILSVWICVCSACVDAWISSLTFLLHLPSLFFLSEVTVVLLFFVLRTGIAALFLSVGGPCEALQRKYLLCYSGHFFGGILLETARLSPPLHHHRSWTIAHHTTGVDWDVVRVGGCFGRGESVCSMWAQIKSLVHVSAFVIVSVLQFYGFVSTWPYTNSW